MLCVELVEIGPVILEKKCVKSLRTDRRRTGDQKSSLELSAEVSLNKTKYEMHIYLY